MLYKAYDLIALHYPGWGLSEIKGLTARERKWFVDLIRWRKERRSV